MNDSRHTTKRFLPPAVLCLLQLLATGAPLPAFQTPPEFPQLRLDALAPGIRAQIQKAYAATRQQPRDAAAAGQLGMVLQAYEDHEHAAVCYERARRLAPREFRWVYLLATAQQALGQQREAIATLRAALQLDRDYLPAQLKLAEALLAAGALPESQQLYEALAHKHAEIAQIHYGLGRVNAAQRNDAASAEHLRKAVELFPGYGAAHYALALALRDSGERAKAGEHLALAQQFKTVRPPLADPLLYEVADLNQGATEHIRKGIALEAAGRLDESIAEHERALEINPQLTQAHINLIQLYGRTGAAAKAEEHYRAVVALDPDLAESHYNYGVMLAAQKRLAEATEAFRRAVEINPQFADAQMNYGAMLEAQQQYDEALKHYRRAVESKPNHRQALFHLARMLIYKGQLPEAIQHLHRTLMPEDEQTPRFTYALAATYARAGDRVNGLKYIRLARDRAADLKQAELLALIERDLKSLEEDK